MRFDIIGDLHGCFKEFKELTELLGYDWADGIPVHPHGRKLAFVGDLTDRGPQSLKIIEVVWELVINKKSAYYVPGNHCNKLYRFSLGNKVQISHGLETTVAEYEERTVQQKKAIRQKFIELYEQAPLCRELDERKLVIAHAGIREEYIGKINPKVQTFVLYGDITGEKHPDGSPVRLDWAAHYTGVPCIVYGHTPVKDVRIINNTYNIDTGAVFGGKLSALRYPEKEVFSVLSSLPFVVEKFKEFT